MSERDHKLFTLPKNLYATGSPVIIAAGALLKDNQTGKVLAQLKLRNIGRKAIKATTVSVEPLDTVGKPLGEPVTYQYLDLHTDRDENFGQETPIALPDAATRSFAISVTEVIFTDNSIWNDDTPEWKSLSRPKSLDVLGEWELKKQFRIEYGSGCENLLLEQRDLWYCVCGAVNRQEESNCHKCRRALGKLQAIDLDDLRIKEEERVATERAEAEAERLKAQKKAEIDTAHAKKIGKITILAILVLAVITIAVGIVSENAEKSKVYEYAQTLLDIGKFEKASSVFASLEDYRDSAEKKQCADQKQEAKLQEHQYRVAIANYRAGNYENAIKGFSALGLYEDSAEMLEKSIKAMQDAIAESTSKATQETISPIDETIFIDTDCDHIIEIIPGKEGQGIVATCRFCGASTDDLDAAGIEWRHESCEGECDWKVVMQTNGTPVYECSKCHNIRLCTSPFLSQLRLLSDTNAKGKHEDVKFGSFYEKGRRWDDLVRFWVIDRDGYSNTESMEVYLAGAYSELVALAFAGKESDKNANMSLRFYGDGKLLYEMNDIVWDAEDGYNDANIDVRGVSILKVECTTDVNAFGYCFLDGCVWLN